MVVLISMMGVLSRNIGDPNFSDVFPAIQVDISDNWSVWNRPSHCYRGPERNRHYVVSNRFFGSQEQFELYVSWNGVLAFAIF